MRTFTQTNDEVASLIVEAYTDGIYDLKNAIKENIGCFQNNMGIDEYMAICIEKLLDCDYSQDEEAVEAPEEDVIESPNHYCRDNGMECIEEIRMVFGDEVAAHFCLGNIWKYRYRAADKNGAEDIAKSDKYIRMYRKITGQTETDFSI